MSIHFQDSGTIHGQLTDYGIDQVLGGSWLPGERIPSVRQLAAEAGVNPNTVMVAYRRLEEEGIIRNQRGLGFFVSEDGQTKARRIRKKDFIDATLPKLSHDLSLLGIEPLELIELLRHYENRTV